MRAFLRLYPARLRGIAQYGIDPGLRAEDDGHLISCTGRTRTIYPDKFKRNAFH